MFSLRRCTERGFERACFIFVSLRHRGMVGAGLLCVVCLVGFWFLFHFPTHVHCHQCGAPFLCNSYFLSDPSCLCGLGIKKHESVESSCSKKMDAIKKLEPLRFVVKHCFSIFKITFSSFRFYRHGIILICVVTSLLQLVFTKSHFDPQNSRNLKFCFVVPSFMKIPLAHCKNICLCLHIMVWSFNLGQLSGKVETRNYAIVCLGNTIHCVLFCKKMQRNQMNLVTRLIGFFRQQLWLVFGSQRKLVSHLLVGQIEEPTDVA